MYREHARLLCRCLHLVALIALLPESATANVALHPLEIRRHWSMQDELAEGSIPEEVRAELAANGIPEGSLILRNWYRTLPADDRWTPDGAVRTEAIVLFDLGFDGIRFKWVTDEDHTTGEMVQKLVIWKGPERLQAIEVERQNAWKGGDLSGFIEEGRRRRERGQMPTNDESVVTVSFSGREWTASDDDWMHGTLLPEDRAALQAATGDDLLHTLELIEAVAQMEPSLLTLCMTVTHPLLGRYDDQCEYHPGAIDLMASPPDCRFDARFGETCSAAQQMASDRRDQPELTAPADATD